MKTSPCCRIVRAATAFVVILVTGCTLLSPVQQETRREVLYQMPLEIPQKDIHPVTLLVLPPETNPTFDTTRMAYRIKPYEINYYSHHVWSAPPARMLTPLLVKTLENTGYFSEVLIPPYPGSYTYALRTWITELTQDFTSDTATMQLSLRAQLLDGATGQVIATREITLKEPMQNKTAEEGVVAANKATANALEEIARFVLDKSERQ